MSAILPAWFFSVLIISLCGPLPALLTPTLDTNALAEGDCLISAWVEAELDIFSGNPNPVWILSGADGILFLKKLAMLPRASARGLHDNLGYRGFIVKVINETGEGLVRISLVRIQNGTVQISQNNTTVYYSDQDRHLERWLLNSGKPTLRSDLFKMVERDFLENSTNPPIPRLRLSSK
jgi:hypothetical protein